MTNVGRVTALIDGQFGSTGKGVIAAHLAERFDIHVRVGAPNAGHSFYWKDVKTVRQSIPVGHINENAQIVIGRGALINMEILLREFNEIMQIDPGFSLRFMVDKYAGIIDEWHVEAEGHTTGEIHKRIGSTGEGVGAARVDRVRRDPEHFRHFHEVMHYYGLEDQMCENVAKYLRVQRKQGRHILLEGSQGAGLDLIHGNWPYVTSNGCGSAQLAADVGIPPTALVSSIMVVRTHPIRVAGNSGPLPNEITWEELSKRLGKEVTEKTTVTKKTRRIATWDDEIIDMAITLNEPTHIALTFLDYLNPADEGVRKFENLSTPSRAFIERIEDKWNIPVAWLGTGGPRWQVIDRGYAL